jgi:ribosomal protein L37AE/L43A
MQIEQRWPCPQCGNRRTLQWAKARYHCFNCKHQWHGHRHVQQRRVEIDLNAVFTPAEMARLEVYRRAVRSGFYSDELPIAVAA